jgi:hypothetical protein
VSRFKSAQENYKQNTQKKKLGEKKTKQNSERKNTKKPDLSINIKLAEIQICTQKKTGKKKRRDKILKEKNEET